MWFREKLKYELGLSLSQWGRSLPQVTASNRIHLCTHIMILYSEISFFKRDRSSYATRRTKHV